MNTLDEEVSDLDIRVANLRILTEALKKDKDSLIEILKNRGFIVREIAPVWFRVAHPQVEGTVVQLEIAPVGSNLDIIMLSNTTEVLKSDFPWGGSFGIKSSVKLYKDNLSFAADRIASFFGLVNEEDPHCVNNWEKVQRDLAYEKKYPQRLA